MKRLLRRSLVVVAMSVALVAGAGHTASADGPLPSNPDTACLQVQLWSVARPTLCVPVYV